MTLINRCCLVGGFKRFLFSIMNIWDNPSHWRSHIFQDGYCTTNQLSNVGRRGFVFKQKSNGRNFGPWAMISYWISPLTGISTCFYRCFKLQTELYRTWKRATVVGIETNCSIVWLLWRVESNLVEVLLSQSPMSFCCPFNSICYVL